MKIACFVPPIVVGYDWFYTDARGVRRKGPPIFGMLRNFNRPLDIWWFRL